MNNAQVEIVLEMNERYNRDRSSDDGTQHETSSDSGDHQRDNSETTEYDYKRVSCCNGSCWKQVFFIMLFVIFVCCILIGGVYVLIEFDIIPFKTARNHSIKTTSDMVSSTTSVTRETFLPLTNFTTYTTATTTLPPTIFTTATATTTGALTTSTTTTLMPVTTPTATTTRIPITTVTATTTSALTTSTTTTLMPVTTPTATTTRIPITTITATTTSALTTSTTTTLMPVTTPTATTTRIPITTVTATTTSALTTSTTTTLMPVTTPTATTTRIPVTTVTATTTGILTTSTTTTTRTTTATIPESCPPILPNPIETINFLLLDNTTNFSNYTHYVLQFDTPVDATIALLVFEFQTKSGSWYLDDISVKRSDGLGSEIIRNGGFENGVFNFLWKYCYPPIPSMSALISQQFCHSGRYCFASRYFYNNNDYLSQSFTIESNTRYTIELYTYCNGKPDLFSATISFQ